MSASLTSLTAHAASPSGGAPATPDKTLQPEEEDFVNTPYTNYGEFNQDMEEDDDLRFLQNGRSVGVSLGIGFESVTGNRGTLWQGGFPLFELGIHYWFNFNIALDLGASFVNQNYTDPAVGGTVNVSMTRVGLDLLYYIDTKDLGAAITFANPHLLGGVASVTKNETTVSSGNVAADTEVGFDFGLGLEFTLVPRKTYFDLDGKVMLVNFNDTYTQKYQGTNSNPRLNDLTGAFLTFTASILFTW